MTTPEQIATWQRARDDTRAHLATDKNAQACRRRREQLRAASLCIFCGHEPNVAPSPLCRVCRERQSAQWHALLVFIVYRLWQDAPAKTVIELSAR
jgi:hypothetical protein